MVGTAGGWILLNSLGLHISGRIKIADGVQDKRNRVLCLLISIQNILYILATLSCVFTIKKNIIWSQSTLKFVLMIFEESAKNTKYILYIPWLYICSCFLKRLFQLCDLSVSTKSSKGTLKHCWLNNSNNHLQRLMKMLI